MLVQNYLQEPTGNLRMHASYIWITYIQYVFLRVVLFELSILTITTKTECDLTCKIEAQLIVRVYFQRQ